MPSDKTSKTLALQTAIITSIVGPILVGAFTIIFQPRAVEKARESVSTLTIPDDRIREIIESTVFVEVGGRGATGFIIAPRYAVTTGSLFENGIDSVQVVRDKGQPRLERHLATLAFLDRESGIAIVDLGRELRVDLVLSAKRGDVRDLDKIFATGYANGEHMVVREGRVSESDGVDPDGRAVIVADLRIEVGMAGCPVFDKDGAVIGMAHSTLAGVTYVVSQGKIEFQLEELRGAG